VLYTFISPLPQLLQAVFYGTAGLLNPTWRPCNIGKLGQDNEDYYYSYYYYYYYYYHHHPILTDKRMPPPSIGRCVR
jgi:hypothetical protein